VGYGGSGTTDIAKNDVVIIDTTNGTINKTAPNKNSMGSIVVDTTTTDSVYVFGVADETIASGSMGRICVRGPHKVNWITTVVQAAPLGKAIGSSTTSGKAAPVSTATGTSRGVLGVGLSNTASTDTGDTNVIWAWISLIS